MNEANVKEREARVADELHEGFGVRGARRRGRRLLTLLLVLTGAAAGTATVASAGPHTGFPPTTDVCAKCHSAHTAQVRKLRIGSGVALTAPSAGELAVVHPTTRQRALGAWGPGFAPRQAVRVHPGPRGALASQVLDDAAVAAARRPHVEGVSLVAIGPSVSMTPSLVASRRPHTWGSWSPLSLGASSEWSIL